MNGRIRQYFFVWRRRTINQVLASLGKYIPASQAMRAYDRLAKRYNTVVRRNQIAIGKRHIISDALRKLVKAGYLVRVGIGIYEIKEKQ